MINRAEHGTLRTIPMHIVLFMRRLDDARAIGERARRPMAREGPEVAFVRAYLERVCRFVVYFNVHSHGPSVKPSTP